MNRDNRNKSLSICSLFCFRECDQSSDRQTINTQEDDLRPDKISLRKIVETEVDKSHTKMKRSISNKNL